MNVSALRVCLLKWLATSGHLLMQFVHASSLQGGHLVCMVGILFVW